GRTRPADDAEVDRRVRAPTGAGPPEDGGVEVENTFLDHARRGHHLADLFLDRHLAGQPPGARLVLVEASAPHPPGDSDMSEPLASPAWPGSVWIDFWRARSPLSLYEILLNLPEAGLLSPAVAVILAAILSRAGRTAVSNFDILDFLFTPLGLLYAAL